ncbi:MAG: thiamine pyrophosphate-dependent enzyme, partial [Acidimicrobiia bacterium]
NHQAIVDVADRAAGWGMPGVIVDGMDAIAVYEVASQAVERARDGGGPTLIEAKTYRFYDHVGIKGMRIPYRSDDEVAQWRQRDPIALLESKLAEAGILSAEAARAVHEEVAAATAEAIAYAESSPLPDVATLLDDVYTA